MDDPAERLSNELTELLRWAFATTGDACYLVDPTSDAVEAAVDVLGATEGADLDVRLLGRKTVFRDVMDDFLVASRAADHVEDGTLSCRVLADPTGHKRNLVVSPSAVTSVLRADGLFAGLRAEDDAYVGRVYDLYETLFAESDPYGLRTPPLGRVESTLERDLGPACRADFADILSNLRTARGDDGPDEVSVSLLVAARNRVQFYDLTKWAEDVGLASKATFSRKKSALEERGLIATQKVPSDVGRPRLRLVVGDDRLAGATAAELAGVVQSAGR